MLSCSVLLSHALQCYVVIDVIWNENLSYLIFGSRWKLLFEYLLRTGVVLLTCELKTVPFDVSSFSFPQKKRRRALASGLSN